MTPQENVLVFPEWLLCTLPNIRGFRPFATAAERHDILNTVLDSTQLHFLPRDKAETDEWNIQVIPYVVFLHRDRILCYTRTKQSGEGRLRGKDSIGFGGHINDVDGLKPLDAYIAGLRRELTEELKHEGDLDFLNLVGCIYDDTTDVGRVHFGLVYTLMLLTPEVSTADESIADLVWCTTEELREAAREDRLENWSKLLVASLESVAPDIAD
jgi:predicted NUDIX family phosphoesterase